MVGYSALEWSVPAMRDAIRRLIVAGGADQATAFVLVSDAVWAVTIVDAAMVRYHPNVYDRVLGSATSTERRLIEESLAGLRYVRNQMRDPAAFAKFVDLANAEDAAGRAAASVWTWRSVTGRPQAHRLPPAETWQETRYGAYAVRLAGHAVGEVFERAQAFLDRTAAEAVVTGPGI